MPNVLARLRMDHRNFARLLGMLETHLEVALTRGDANFELMQDSMLYMTHYPDRFHHPKEDLIFARLGIRDDSARPHVYVLLEEHRTLAEKGLQFLEILRGIGNRGPTPREKLAAAGRDYIGGQRLHMAAEEGHLFSLAREHLLEQDWAEIDKRLEHRADPLFGKVVEGKYRALYEHILRESA